MGKITLVELIKIVDEIPAFSKSVQNVMTLLHEPEANVEDVGSAIMKDQGLTIKILKMANSAFYRGSKQIKTIKRALVLLGLDTVEVLVYAAGVDKIMKQELKGYGYQKDEMWSYSLMSAYIAKTIALKVDFETPDFAFITGLLKDIGKVGLNSLVFESHEDIAELMTNKDVSYLAAEEAVIGFNHCQVGARMIKKWKLSSELAEAIELQQCPSQAVINPTLVAILHLTDAIVVKMDGYKMSNPVSYDFQADVLSILGLNEKDLESLIIKVEEELENEEYLI